MSEKPGFVGQALGVLYRPKEVFRTVDEGDLAKGVIIAVLMVALGAYSTMAYMGKIPLDVLAPQLQGMDAGPVAGSMGAISGVDAGVSMLVAWTFTGLVLHLLGRFSGGEGSLRRFYALYGLAAVPGLLNQVLRVADARTVDASELVGYFLLYREMPAGLLKAVIGANLVNVWSLAGLVLTSLCLQENYRIGGGRAFLFALLPSLALVALTFFTG